MPSYKGLTKQKLASLAHDIALSLKGDDILLLYGSLGSGKTFFTSLLCKSLDVKSTVNSPTFVLLNQYEGRYKINHYDLYRLSRVEDALQLGILENLSEIVTIIEWPELIEHLLPQNCIKIRFSGTGSRRDVTVGTAFIPSASVGDDDNSPASIT